MSFMGRVENGVVVFDQPVSIPEGTTVRVEPILDATPPTKRDWDAAMQAVRDLDGYDFDAWRQQRDYDRQHANDHLL